MKKRTATLFLALFLLSTSSVRASEPPIIISGGNETDPPIVVQGGNVALQILTTIISIVG